MKKLKIFFLQFLKCSIDVQKQPDAIWMKIPIWSMRLYSSLIAQLLLSGIRNSCKFKFKDTFCALTISKHFCSDNLLCVCLLGFYLGNCRRRWTEGIASFEGSLWDHNWIHVRIAAEIPSGGEKTSSLSLYIYRVAGIGKCGGKPAAGLPKYDRMIIIRLFEYFTNY